MKTPYEKFCCEVVDDVDWFFNKLYKFIFLLTLFAATAYGQSDCPPDKVCISIAAANQAAANVRELEATRAKVAVLESAIAEKDKTIAETKLTAAKNESDLREALRRTEIELATKTGQLIGAEAMGAQQRAIIEVLLKYARKKKIGLINLF